MTASELHTHKHTQARHTEPSVQLRRLSCLLAGGIWVMRNKQGLCVCYFLFVPQWTHSAGAEEGEQRRRRRAGRGPRRERGPRPGAEAPHPSASARGLPTTDTQIPGPAPQDFVQVPEKERMPRSHQRGLRGRLGGAPPCPGAGDSNLLQWGLNRGIIWESRVSNILMWAVSYWVFWTWLQYESKRLKGECTNLNQRCHRM